MKVKILLLWAFYAPLCAQIFCPGLTAALEGKIIKIADGDTITLLTTDHDKVKNTLIKAIFCISTNLNPRTTSSELAQESINQCFLKIRLYGIDTPEKAQPYGNRAKQFTASKVGNKQATVEEHGKNRYGRLMGIVKIGKNTSLNEELIKKWFSVCL